MSKKLHSFHLIVLILLLVGLMLSSFIALTFHRYMLEAERQNFLRAFDKATLVVEGTLGSYALVLQSVRSAYATKGKPLTPKEFQIAVDGIRSSSKFPGALAVTFARCIQPKDVPLYVEEVKARQIPFSIQKLGPPQSPEDPICVVEVIEPAEEFLYAFGLDVFSEPHRRKAILQAVETGKATLSERIQLLKREESEKGFGFFYPIYYGTPNSPSERKMQIMGVAYLPIVLDHLMSAISDQVEPQLKLSIYDVKKGSESVQLYGPISDLNSRLEFDLIQNIDVGGRVWTVAAHGRNKGFWTWTNAFPIGIFILLSVINFLTMALLSKSHFLQKKAETVAIQRSAEKDDFQSRLEASAKLAALGEMAGGVAHEINNPLAIIQLRAEIIRKKLSSGLADGPSLIVEVDKILETVSRISKIVKSLKSLIRTGDSANFEKVPLKKLIEDTLELCTERFREKKIDFKVGSIPEVSLECQPTQISQVLINLLNNAFDAVGSLEMKWVELNVKVEEMVTITITDSGKGIPSDVADLLMQPFFTTKGKKEGTGLGLSISKRIVDVHGGELYLDRNCDHTRFVIHLPLAQDT